MMLCQGVVYRLRATLLARGTDDGGRRDVGSTSPLPPVTASAQLSDDSECPFRENRGCDLRDSSSHNLGSAGGDTVRSERSHGRGSRGGNFQPIVRQRHFAREPARSFAWPLDPLLSRTPRHWRRISNLGRRSRNDTGLLRVMPRAVAALPTRRSDVELCEVQNPPTLMLDDEEAVKHLERDRRDREEVECDDRLAMILEKGQPALAGITAPSNSAKVTGHTPFGDGEPELLKFSVDLRRSPIWVLSRQALDQDTDLCCYPGSTAAGSRAPTPVQPKPGAMPANDGLGFDDE